MFRIGHTQAGYLFQNLLDKTGEKLFPCYTNRVLYVLAMAFI